MYYVILSNAKNIVYVINTLFMFRSVIIVPARAKYYCIIIGKTSIFETNPNGQIRFERTVRDRVTSRSRLVIVVIVIRS